MRTPDEILADIINIKNQINNVVSEERIDDMTIRYRNLNELQEILKDLQDELTEANGGKVSKSVFAGRRGFYGAKNN